MVEEGESREVGFTQEKVKVLLDDTPPGVVNVLARNGNRPFDSKIGDIQNGCRPFVLEVRAFLEPHPPGEHTFPNFGSRVTVQVQPLSSSDQATFKREAIADVNRMWNRDGRGRLWLKTIDITRGHQGLGRSNTIPPPLKCLVSLSWTEDADSAHLRVQVMNTGRGANPRSSCYVGGRPLWSDADMTMHHFQAGQEQDNSGHPIRSGENPPAAEPGPYQKVFAHEFGHYLGLRHSFPGSASANEAYGIGMNNRTLFYYIMGVGSDMIGRATRPWSRQLRHHQYFSGRNFRPTPQQREAESVRARVGWSLQEPSGEMMARHMNVRNAL